MNNSEQKKETTKNRIIDTFWELYEHKKIEKITVSEITALAKINRSTFYVYFNDVYDVLEQIELRYLPGKHHCNFPEDTDTDSAKMKEFRDLIEKDPEILFDKFIEDFEKNRKYIGVLLSENGDPNFSVRLKNALRPIVKSHMCKELEDSPKLDLILEYLLSAVTGTMTHWLNNPSGISSKELFLMLHDLLKDGIQENLKHIKKKDPSGQKNKH